MEAITALYHKWILPSSWRIALVVLGVLLVIAAGKILGARRTDRAGVAFAALSKAREAKVEDGQKTAEALLAVAKEYDGTLVAARAQVEAAGLLFGEGQFEQAAAKFALARKNAQQNESVRLAATLGEAYALEAQGKAEPAEKMFADLAATAGSKAMALDAWLGAGRCAKAGGKLAEAEKYCDRATEAAGDNPISRRRTDEAKAALRAARHAKPAAVAPPASAEPPAPATPAEPSATEAVPAPAAPAPATPAAATPAAETPPATPAPAAAAPAEPAPAAPAAK
jgi:tetratricopeptide (TPR) repeat protein